MLKNSDTMFRHVSFVMLVLCFTLTGCTGMNDFAPDDLSGVRYGSEFLIPLHRTVKTIDNDYTIRFDSVLTDSRCPEGVYCFWSGIAGIRLTVGGRRGETESVDLYTYDFREYSDTVTYKNLKVKLINLIPYPSSGKEISPDSYKAKLILSKI